MTKYHAHATNYYFSIPIPIRIKKYFDVFFLQKYIQNYIAYKIYIKKTSFHKNVKIIYKNYLYLLFLNFDAYL